MSRTKRMDLSPEALIMNTVYGAPYQGHQILSLILKRSRSSLGNRMVGVHFSHQHDET